MNEFLLTLHLFKFRRDINDRAMCKERKDTFGIAQMCLFFKSG